MLEATVRLLAFSDFTLVRSKARVILQSAVDNANIVHMETTMSRFALVPRPRPLCIYSVSMNNGLARESIDSKSVVAIGTIRMNTPEKSL